ncbi:hypothetical protein RhiJN_27057 [Ceratobasidium sp. AG-Ba]|nr:hypothetical protein RhiJN_27057 [Ceratobasidium sp. AG-Ba]
MRKDQALPLRDDRGQFLPRSASSSSASAVPGAFPTPVSLAGPKVSTPPIPSLESSSPDLESLILEFSNPSTPLLVNTALDLSGVPFPSPQPDPPVFPSFSPSTPTPHQQT